MASVHPQPPKHTTIPSPDRPAWLRPVAAGERAPAEAVTIEEAVTEELERVDLMRIRNALGVLEDQAEILGLATDSALTGDPRGGLIAGAFERLIDRIVEISADVVRLEMRLEK